MTGFWIAMFGVGVAAGLAGIGSSIGVGIPSRAAAGVLSEQPDRFGRMFILVVLPSTQGFYGFIAAMFMMMKIGRRHIPGRKVWCWNWNHIHMTEPP